MLWADLMMRYLYFVWRERLSALAFDRAMFGPSPSEANDYETGDSNMGSSRAGDSDMGSP